MARGRMGHGPPQLSALPPAALFPDIWCPFSVSSLPEQLLLLPSFSPLLYEAKRSTRDGRIGEHVDNGAHSSGKEHGAAAAATATTALTEARPV